MIAAGPAVNIGLAFILLTVVYLNVREPVGFSVDKVEAGTPAAKVLKQGDRFVSIDGTPARVRDVSSIDKVKRRLKFADYKSRHLSKLITRHGCTTPKQAGCIPDRRVRLVVSRNGQILRLDPRTYFDPNAPPLKEGDPKGRYRLGFGFGTVGTQTSHQSVGEAADLALDRMWFVTSQTVSKIARLFNAEDRKQLSGVVGTSSALNQAIDFSPRIALYVLALISLSLGVINLFPFLPLDGGHIFWSVIEKIRGQRVPFSWIDVPAPSASCW